MKKLFFVYIIFAIFVSLIWTSFADADTPLNHTWLSLEYFLNYFSRVPTVDLTNLSFQVFNFEIADNLFGDFLTIIGYAIGAVRFGGVLIYNFFLCSVYFIKFFIDSTFGFEILPFDPNTSTPSLLPGTSGAGGGFGGGGGGSW